MIEWKVGNIMKWQTLPIKSNVHQVLFTSTFGTVYIRINDVVYTESSPEFEQAFKEERLWEALRV